MSGRERQPFSVSLSAFAGVKESFLEAAILIVAPVDGLRPSRAGVFLTWNFPKPGMLVSAPERAASKIFLNTLDDCLGLRLGQFCSAAILSAISVVVVIRFDTSLLMRATLEHYSHTDDTDNSAGLLVVSIFHYGCEGRNRILQPMAAKARPDRPTRRSPMKGQAVISLFHFGGNGSRRQWISCPPAGTRSPARSAAAHCRP